MKKYKLIKEYPGSPCFGTEIIEAADIRGRYFIKRSDIWFINNPEKYPEYWENVIEKNYEILSFISTNTAIGEKEGVIRYINDDGYTVDDYLYNGESVKNGAYLIHSIKRLSNGEIFTIGDKIKAFNRTEIINKFYQGIYNSQKHILFWNLGYNVNELVKIKQPLFTTEDDVDIFEGDMYSYVNFLLTTYHIKAYADHNVRKDMKMFSTKEKAEEYILMNKKSLSPNDILKVWSGLSGYSISSLMENSKLLAAILKHLKDENNKK